MRAWPFIISPLGRRRFRRGFSLVITLLMMVLLSTIALGLLSLSTISLRASGHGAAQATARANARLALMTAIGDLQKQMGPDTRVSAPAALKTAGTSQSRWIAAYNTLDPATGMPPVGRMAGGSLQQYSTDMRAKASNWRDTYRLGWLVSQPNGGTLTPESPGTDLITMSEFETAGSAKQKVEVPRVEILDEKGNKAGSYAYWVTDESTKARLDQIDPRAKGTQTLAIDDQSNSLLMAQRADASKTAGFDWQEKISVETAAKLVSDGNLKLASAKPEDTEKHGGSFTVNSMGVLCDPVTGGLKIDLGAYLDSTGETDPNIDLRSTGRGVMSDLSSFVPGQRYASTGGFYGSLRGWRRIGLSAAGATADPEKLAIEPRFPANRSTTRSGSQVREGRGVDSDNSARLKVTKATGGTEVGVPIHPVIADARFSMDFVYDKTSSTPKFVPLIYPRVKIWNPYNVALTQANYVVVMPFRSSGATFKVGVAGATTDVNLKTVMDNAGMGDMSVRYLVFTVPEATFGPGECKVFMPDLSSGGSASFPKGGGGTYAKRYDPNSVSSNALTASLDNAPNGAFYIESSSGVLPATVFAGTPTIQCSTSQHVFIAEGWFLKGATGSTSVSAANVIDSSSGSDFPTLQSVYVGIRGIDSYGSGYDEWDFTWNKPPVREFLSQADGRLSGNVYAPLQWSRHLRFLYLGERPTLFNDLNRTADELRITAALSNDWNPRANIHVRFPSVPSGSWYWRFRHPFVSPVERESAAVLAAGTAAAGDSYVASPFWSESASAYRASQFSLFDVQPATMPLLSIARLRHVALSPFGWQPTYPIAGSRPPFYTDAGSTVMAAIVDKSASDQWQKMKADGATSTNTEDIVGPGVTAQDQMLLYDMSFDANAALFDRYFLSGLPRNSSGKTTWDGTSPLANSRLVRSPGTLSGTPSAILKLPADEASKPAAMFMQSGSFNVNSIDVEAWKAVLSGLRGSKRATAKGDSRSKHPFARTFAPLDPNGPDSSGAFSSANFNGMPDIDDSEISDLASAIVDEVKLRGPFLSLSDFINRRLVPDKSGSPDPTALYGVLDAAIASTSINREVQNSAVAQTGLQVASTDGIGTTMEVDYRHLSPSRSSGSPGSLTQGDLLEPLAPVLTARGDTFVVRAYGDARDASGKILARAWCEAVVQRLPEYLEHLAPGQTGKGNDPATPVLTETWSDSGGHPFATGALVQNKALTPVNLKFGRRFEIARFRWLSPSDIQS